MAIFILTTCPICTARKHCQNASKEKKEKILIAFFKFGGFIYGK